MCKWGTDKLIYCIRRNHPDYSDGWHPIHVDACIADYVQEMNRRGIITLNCCCGHGKDVGYVIIDPSSACLMERHNYEYITQNDSFITESGQNYTETRLYHFLPKVEIWKGGQGDEQR